MTRAGRRSRVEHDVAFGLAVVAAAALVILAFKVVLVLFAGLLSAIVLGSAATRVAERTRAPRGVALALMVCAGLALTAFTAVNSAPSVTDQLGALAEELPRALQRLTERFHSQPAVRDTLSHAVGPATAIEPGRLGRLAMRAIGSSVEVASGLVIVFFVGVYGAAQPEVYLKAVASLAPRPKRGRAERALRSVGHNLSRWLWGRLIAMVFVGVTTSIAFVLLHVPLALGLGTLAGLLTFIEYIGAVASGVPPALIAFAQAPSKGLAVLAIFVGVHVVEGYVLTPLLTRATVRLPPAFTLATQVVLGSLTGVLGLTFSTPLLVTIVSFLQSWEGHELPAAGREELKGHE